MNKNQKKKSINTERLISNKKLLNENFSKNKINNNNNILVAIDKNQDDLNTYTSRKNTFYNSNSKITNISNSHINNHIHIIAENKTTKNKSRNINNNMLYKINTNNVENNKNSLFISQPQLIYTITQTNNYFSPNSLNKNKIKIKVQKKKSSINSILLQLLKLLIHIEEAIQI